MGNTDDDAVLPWLIHHSSPSLLSPNFQPGGEVVDLCYLIRGPFEIIEFVQEKQQAVRYGTQMHPLYVVLPSFWEAVFEGKQTFFCLFSEHSVWKPGHLLSRQQIPQLRWDVPGQISASGGVMLKGLLTGTLSVDSWHFPSWPAFLLMAWHRDHVQLELLHASLS